MNSPAVDVVFIAVSQAQTTQVTYRFERWRSIASGILETAGTTFLLLIAVRHFHAGPIAKGLIAGSGSIGLLISPWVVSRVTALGYPTSRAAAAIWFLGSASFLAAALIPYLPVYIIATVTGMACSAAGIPLMTQMYQENYPAKARGSFFSRTVMIRIATAAMFSHLAGRALTGENIQFFQLLLVVFSASFAFGAWCLSRCPTRPLTQAGGTHPFRALRYVKEDVLFRRTLICWMLMGFGNLMMLPMRVEYLANPKYGLALSVSMIAMVTGVVPNLARLVLSPIWGWLFDRMNFFLLRVVLNLGFAIGILSFFTSDHLWGLVTAAVIFGIANAGGDVAWSLWVTKFAAPERVADYMSVHTFFTGARGVVAPLVAFWGAQHVPLSWLAVISGSLIVAASLLLLPEISWRQRTRKGTPLVEEISE